MTDFTAARINMVDGQLRPNRVSEPGLIQAMNEIPREAFVPAGRREIAYLDEEQPLPGGRWLLEPMILAQMIQALHVGPQDMVMDVGCATGYSTAVLARLAATVVGIESDAALRESAGKALVALGVDTAALIDAPLTQGYPAQSPYDAIFINGMVAEIPDTLLQQLGEGGRLVAIVSLESPLSRLGQVQLVQRVGGTFSTTALFETAGHILPGFEARPRFVF